MEKHPLCQYRDWDSEFFGRRIAQITENRLTADSLESIITWCTSQKIACLYFLADINDAETIRVVEQNRFHWVDIRVTLETALAHPVKFREHADDIPIRLSREEDISILKALANVNHHDSRFYYDPHFPDALCDALYETWIEKSCHGYADAVFVAELHGQPAGYISCHLREAAHGQIGLVGVSAAAQGQGIGPRLVEAALRWFGERGIKRVTVVTQGRNAKAQRLYQRGGFVTQSMQLWYHRWFIS